MSISVLWFWSCVLPLTVVHTRETEHTDSAPEGLNEAKDELQEHSKWNLTAGRNEVSGPD